MPRPLEGIRVIELAQFLSGPRTGQIMADLGAEIIKVEPLNGEAMRMLMGLLKDGERSFSVFHRNKKAITLNIRTERGKDILKRLAAKSDVFIENYTPGTLDDMGLGYENLMEYNPRLIYASISGFGKTGPLREKTSFDLIAQATGGILFANGHPDEPPGVFFGDLVSGAYAALGILVAL